MHKHQSGFTLIELVIIIVILGILAAIAIPRYVDLTDQAETAVCDGARGALLSTAAILIAESSTTGATGQPGTTAQIISGTIADGWEAEDTSPTITVHVPSNPGDTTCQTIDLVSEGLAVAP